MGDIKQTNFRIFFPRKWECSYSRETILKKQLLFPTQVGVFLEAKTNTGTKEPFSHASGSVP